MRIFCLPELLSPMQQGHQVNARFVAVQKTSQLQLCAAVLSRKICFLISFLLICDL
jgi:hypothetical protein